MTYSALPRTSARWSSGVLVVGLVALVAAVAAGLGLVPSSTSTAGAHAGLPRTERIGAGDAGGRVGDGVTVFDDRTPAVTKLAPDLLDALRRAASDAAQDGVVFHVNSGWRSAEYQEELLRDAVAKYGSEEEAARWVATPETSVHVSGDAVDIGPSDASAWLSAHGSAYALCQIYVNESWHYELRLDAVDQGCPPMYADPTQDPRMQP